MKDEEVVDGFSGGGSFRGWFRMKKWLMVFLVGVLVVGLVCGDVQRLDQSTMTVTEDLLNSDGMENPKITAENMHKAMDFEKHWDKFSSKLQKGALEKHPDELMRRLTPEQIVNDNGGKPDLNKVKLLQENDNVWSEVGKNSKTNEVLNEMFDRKDIKGMPENTKWVNDKLSLGEGKAEYTKDQLKNAEKIDVNPDGSAHMELVEGDFVWDSGDWKPVEGPQPTGPNGPGCPGGNCGDGGGGGGGGGGGNGGGEKGQEAFNAGVDAASKISPLLEGLKPKPSPDNSPPSPEGGISPSIMTDMYGREEGEEEEGAGGPEVRLTKNSDGTNFRFVDNKLDLIKDGGVMQISSIPNIDGTYAEVTAVGGNVNELELTNTITRVSNPEPIADLYTPSETTPLTLNPASGEPAIANSPITAAAISDISSNQFIKLINYDLAFGGERILIDVFKSFETVSGNGEKLYVKNGEMYLKFNGMKIYYSRRIKNTPHSLGEISNVKDRENKFSLIEYVENKGRLVDMRSRVSVGDEAVLNPRDGRLKIASVREKMWVKR